MYSFHTIGSDQIQFLPTNSSQLQFPFLFHITLCFFLNPSSPICAPHIIFPAWHFRGLWLTYQGPQSWGKMISLSLKLSIANSFLTRGGILSPLPLSTLGFWAAWACVGLTHIALTSVHLYVQLPCCDGKHYFLVLIHCLWLLDSCSLLFFNCPWALGREGVL